MTRRGIIIDSTIIFAPCSVKKPGKRDQEFHQTRRDNQSFFGMKIHIAIDAAMVLTVSVTCFSCSIPTMEATVYQ